MKYPFRIEFVSHPADADHCIIVAADHETVGELWSATREEATELVRMANVAWGVQEMFRMGGPLALTLTQEEVDTVMALRSGAAKVVLRLG